MTEKRYKVNGHVLKKAAAALRSQMRLTPRVQTVNRTFSLKTIQLSAAFGSAVMMLILLGIYRYQGGLDERVQHFLQGVYPKTQNFSASEALPVSATATDLQVQPVPTKPDAEIRMQSFDEAHAPESQSTQGGLAALLPEMNLKAEPPDSQGEKAYSIKISPLLSVKDVKPVFITAASHVSQKVLVKKGDTLTGIASRFFPANPLAGVKKILANNPMLDDKGRIYPGQELIIPYAGGS
jgi:nucleoid-associated protein YgaU